LVRGIKTGLGTEPTLNPRVVPDDAKDTLPEEKCAEDDHQANVLNLSHELTKFYKTFSPLFKIFNNKLECLFKPSPSILVKYLRFRIEP
jgi:hypothetical protein